MKPKAILKFTAEASRIASASFPVFIGGECGASRSQSEAHRAGARARGGSPGRRRPTFRGAAAAALLLAVAFAPDASAQSAHKTKSCLLVRDMTVGPEVWAHGTTVHRFVIENPTDLRRTVTLSMPGAHYGSDGLESMVATVAVEGRSSASVAMPQPPVDFEGSQNFRVEERGTEPSVFGLEAESLSQYYHYSGDPALPALLLSRSLSGEEFIAAWHGTLESRLKVSGSYSGAASNFKTFRLMREPEAWPREWVDYSAFDGCFVAEEDYRRFTAETRGALMDYAAAGGAVVLVNLRTLPPEWTARLAGEPAPGQAVDGLLVGRFGFGHVALLENLDPQTWGGADVQNRLMTCLEHAGKPWMAQMGHRNYDMQDCLRDIPLGHDMGVPVNFFFFLLLAFAIVAGPLAVWLAAKHNRRMWLLWAVPAFGLLFSAVIFASILLVEGVTPTQRRQAITLLDQTTRQAVTLGAVGVYAPAAIRDGLSFDYGTEIAPIRSGEEKGARIVFGQRQRYLDWVPPRMAAFFRLRRSETRAERLVVERKDDGALEVVNALGAPIERLRLWDEAGVLHEAMNVPPGARQALRPVDKDVSPAQAQDVYAWMREYAYAVQEPGWSFAIRDKGARTSGFAPAPRTYVAHLAGCPFLENPLGDRKTKGSDAALVAGRY